MEEITLTSAKDFMEQAEDPTSKVARRIAVDEKMMELLYWKRRHQVLTQLMRKHTLEELEDIVMYENDIDWIPKLGDNPQWMDLLPTYDGKTMGECGVPNGEYTDTNYKDKR